MILQMLAARAATYKGLLLVVAAVPILILKNGVRIVTVSLLSIYVSRDFLHGWIHTSGGILAKRGQNRCCNHRAPPAGG
jgi:exosortase/archaeosortase family protein